MKQLLAILALLVFIPVEQALSATTSSSCFPSPKKASATVQVSKKKHKRPGHVRRYLKKEQKKKEKQAREKANAKQAKFAEFTITV